MVIAAERPARLRAGLQVHLKGEGSIGAGRADEMAVSGVLPFVSALRPQAHQPVQLFTVYPSPPSNRWTRVVQDLLARGGHQLLPKKATVHQGMYYCYHTYCRAQRHGRCPLCLAASRLRGEESDR
jgi:hypothetical protein